MMSMVRPRLGRLTDVDIDAAGVPNAGVNPGARLRSRSNGVVVKRSEFATGLLDGRVYRLGGWNGGEVATCLWWDIAGETWGTGTAMPAARRGLQHQNTADGTYVYAVGGSNGGAVDTTYRYDPTEDTWANVATLPAPRQMGACVHTSGGVLWYAGGSDGGPGTFHSTLWRFGGASWTTGYTDMSTVRRDAPMVHHNGTLYVFGGETSAGTRTAGCEAYDIANDTWTAIANLPEPRRGAAAFYCLGSIFLLGGNTATNASDNSIYRYDIAANTWDTDQVDLTEGFKRGGACTSDDGFFGWVQPGSLGSSGTNNSQRLWAVNYDDPLDYDAGGDPHGTWIGDGP